MAYTFGDTALQSLTLITYSTESQLLNGGKIKQSFDRYGPLKFSGVPRKRFGNAWPTICIMNGSGMVLFFFFLTVL
jgi:hypothetical protein